MTGVQTCALPISLGTFNVSIIQSSGQLNYWVSAGTTVIKYLKIPLIGNSTYATFNYTGLTYWNTTTTFGLNASANANTCTEDSCDGPEVGNDPANANDEDLDTYAESGTTGDPTKWTYIYSNFTWNLTDPAKILWQTKHQIEIGRASCRERV